MRDARFDGEIGGIVGQPEAGEIGGIDAVTGRGEKVDRGTEFDFGRGAGKLAVQHE
jgi:hypothetical protein